MKKHGKLSINMNALLKLEFFKSLGFPTKESGVEFIKQNPKLKAKIEEKAEELEEVKYQIIENIKENVFSKFEIQKEVFMVGVKAEKAKKLAHKKELQKMSLKQELRSELLNEIQNEEKEERMNKMKKKYPNAYPNINTDFDIQELEHLFSSIIKKIDSDDLDEDNLVIIEKQKAQVEKAFEMLQKVKVIMKKLNKE